MRLTVLLLFSFITILRFADGQNLISNEHQLWANESYSNFRLQDEDVSKRTVDSKHFIVGAKGTAIVSAGFLNYYEDNQWKTIYHTILPTSNGFSNETNAFKSYYPLNSNGQALTILPNGGEVKDLMQIQMSYLNDGMGQVSTKSISSKTGVANKFELTYPKVFGNNIDLRLTQMTTKRKLDYILKNRNALSDVPSSARYLCFSEVVELQQGWTLHLLNNEILIKDQNGKVKALFDAPIVRETALHTHDKNGNHIDNHDHEINATFSVELVGSYRYKVSTIVPLEWLLSSERKFPIFVDPTINCYPDNAAQWTGHLRLNGTNSTNYLTNTIGLRQNDWMCLGRRESPSPFAHFNSWAKFNLVTVPNSAILCRVRLNYTVYDTYSGDASCITGAYINLMGIDPVPATDAALLAGIRSGNTLMTRNFGSGNGTDGNKTTPDFANLTPFQNAIINPDWISLGFQYYDGGPHTTCSLKIRGYSHSAKPYLIIDYNNASSFSNVGYTGQSNGTIPPNPNCTDWSNTWCAGSGTFTPIPNIVQGVNYTIENVGSGGCNPVLTNAYLQAWAPGGADCGRTPVGSHALNNYSFNATNNGTYYFNVSSGLCANNNTCGSFTGHDWTGTSAVLRYRQNTTVTNTTPITDLCVGQTRPLTATLGGTHNNPTVIWTITSGSNLGTISGNTFTAGNTAGQVTIQATVGFCSQSITFNIVNGPTVTPVTQAICSGETVNIPIQASPPQASYSWSVNSNNVSGASNGTGTNINQTLALVNTGNSGSVTYTVTAGSGACAGTGNIIVNVNPPPSVSISPVTICAGASATLTATPNFGGGTYNWSNGATTQNIVVNPTTTASYSVTYSLGQCTPATATQTVTVTPAPTVSVTSITICEGETSSLTANPTEAGGTYAWSSGGNTATISVNPTTTGNYTVTYSLGSCTPATASATVTVNPAPTVSVSPITICSGESSTLSATVSEAGGTYLWSPGGATTSSISVNPTSNTSYSVTYTLGFCTPQTATAQVTVNPAPTVTINPLTICSGETGTLTATVTQPGGDFIWSPGGATTSSISVNPTTSTSYSVTYTLGQCTPGTATVNVVVNPAPTVSIAPLTICEGETNNLVATPSETGGTYLWSPNGQTTSSISINPTTTASYSVTYSLGQCTPATATQTVTVTPAPTVSVTSITICEGETSSLTANPTEAGGTYAWSSGGNTATISVNPTTTGNYTVTYSLGSCTPATASATVTVNPAPTVSVSPITICSGESSTLSATVSEAGGTYLWSPGGATTSSISVNPTSNTSYSVTYTLGFCAPQTATAQVTVNPAPTVTINPLTICSGETGTLTATVTQPGGDFIWSPGGATTSSISVNPTTGTSYSVTYTLGQCTPGTATVNVFVNPAPTVSINTTSICAGQSATLTATPTETGGTYVWSPGGQTSQAITVNPTQTSTYSVTYSLGQCTQATSTSTLTVQPVPTITLSSPTICTGTNANITATVLPTGGSYSWSTGATTNSLSVNPTTNTNYSLTYSVNGCTNNAQTTVTVFETPTVTVNSPTICAGESTTITATATPSGGTYLWSNNAANSTQVLTPTGTISYNVLYVLQGCNATATSTITVNPVPTLTVDGATICAGESTTLTAIPNLQGGTFLWSPNGETTSVISVTPGQTSNYSVVYTLNNCLSPSIAATVTVNPMPIVTVNSGQICSGDNFTLQANGTPLGGTYTWTGHANTTSQLIVSPSSTTSYSVNYTLNGCVSQSATGVVDILASPVASFTASATQGCTPLTVTFTNTSTSSSGDITGCLWGFGNTTSSGCGSMSQTFTQPGCYNISLSVTANGCTTIQTMPNMICVQADPVASFMTNPNSFSQTSQEITFVNTSTGATQFEWDFGNGNTSNDFSPSHFYTNTSGGQTVILTASTSYGCTAQASVFIPFTESELIYVPNSFTPDGDMFNQVFTPVFTSGYDPYNFEMTIFNRWGEVVFVTYDAKRGWDGSYGELGRDCQAGLYIYKIIYKNPQKDERKIITGHVNLLR